MKKRFWLWLIISFIVIVLIAGGLVAAEAGLWSPIHSLKEAYCLRHGGETVQDGCGIANCGSHCAIPYRDAGQACQGPKDCRGECVVVSPQIEADNFIDLKPPKECVDGPNGNLSCPTLDIQAVCSRLPLDNCRGEWIYLGNHEINYYMRGCTM